MIKRRLFWVITALVALVVVVLVLFLPNQNDLSVIKTKADQLPEGRNILVNAWSEFQGVQKGDAFYYIVEVLFNPDQISGVDKDSLDENVNLSPFEIRTTEEKEFNLDSNTRVYQRLYEIQFISGNVERLYDFPSIVVRYELRGADGYAETSVTPESIYVAPRLPANGLKIISGMQDGLYSLQPMNGGIEKTGQNSLSWILWFIGGVLVVAMTYNLTTGVIPQWKKERNLKKTSKMSDLLYQAYHSLNKNIETGVAPGRILHQIDHIIRVLLSPKEQTGWLEEQNFDLVAEEIRETMISLFDKSQAAYIKEDIKQQDVEEAMKQLNEILEFYYAENVGEWKS